MNAANSKHVQQGFRESKIVDQEEIVEKMQSF